MCLFRYIRPYYTEVNRCVLTASNVASLFSTVWSVVKSIMRNEGPQGFFQGLTTTIAREVPGYFCFFGAYELCRTTFADYMKCDKDDIGTGQIFSCVLIKRQMWKLIY